ATASRRPRGRGISAPATRGGPRARAGGARLARRAGAAGASSAGDALTQAAAGRGTCIYGRSEPRRGGEPAGRASGHGQDTYPRWAGSTARGHGAGRGLIGAGAGARRGDLALAG